MVFTGQLKTFTVIGQFIDQDTGKVEWKHMDIRPYVKAPDQPKKAAPPKKKPPAKSAPLAASAPAKTGRRRTIK